jgi:hypothetical protein
MVPGDPERNHMKLVDEEGGVPYHENQLKASVSHTKRTGLELCGVRMLHTAKCYVTGSVVKPRTVRSV